MEPIAADQGQQKDCEETGKESTKTTSRKTSKETA
jgi:hypothetical protein